MPRSLRVLVVDDLADARWALAELVRREGMEVEEAEDGAGALQVIGARAPDVVVLDVRMPGMNGIDALREARRLYANLPVILVTAYAEIREAVEAIKAGAFDYLARPFDHRELIGAIHAALGGRYFKDDPGEPGVPPQPTLLARQMGPSVKVRQLSSEVARVACTNLTVVIAGESGSGKELVARAIHGLSRRSCGPLVVVDCGGIPESLVENELFGHERGAFTGADRTTHGKFEAAAGGTLFLDEIANLPVGLQSKLLRALETKEIFRVGSTTMRKVDVRVVAATNRDLGSLMAAGNFRQDLFYRLCEYGIRVPALRERREDIIFLARRFLDSANKEFGRNVRGFCQSAIDSMLDYDWPGNVRELRNVVTRAALLSDHFIEVEHLGLRVMPGTGPGLSSTVLPQAGRPLPLKEVVQRYNAQLERQVLGEVLQQTGGNKAQAARLLGIDYKTILTKIRQYGIAPHRAACQAENPARSSGRHGPGGKPGPEEVEAVSMVGGGEEGAAGAGCGKTEVNTHG